MKIKVAPGRTLTCTPVYETYWKFAHLRQSLMMSRLQGSPPPWTSDPVLTRHRFTNVYRASDRVSQFLIREVIYCGEQSTKEIFFRTMLFKLFNRIETWQALTSALGELSYKTFNAATYERVLDQLIRRQSIYSAAYIMPSPAFGLARKHANHLALLKHMMKDGAHQKVEHAHSLREIFTILKSYPSLGDFLAFQLAIDINYSPITDFSEMDFVVAGPGARDGIRKCFSDVANFDPADVIRAVAEISSSEFERLGLKFSSLWGRRLQLIDCQNLFCEVDKYARVAHPEFTSESGRTRIKQRFTPLGPLPQQWYPPKWRLKVPKVDCGQQKGPTQVDMQRELSFAQ